MSVKWDFKAKEESVGSAVGTVVSSPCCISLFWIQLFKKIKLKKAFLLLNKHEVGFFWHTETADRVYQPQTFYLYMDFFFPIIISVWRFNTSLKRNCKFLLSFSKMDIHFQTVILKFVFHLFSHDAHASDNHPVRLGFLFWVHGFFKSEFLCFST